VNRTLYVDVVGGAAGDMLLAALLDAGVPEQPVWDAVEAVLPGRFACRLHTVHRAGIRASHLAVESPPMVPLERRTLNELLSAVDRAPLPSSVAATARDVIERLGGAEARVHGWSNSEDGAIEHAAGDDDTLLDVVGFAAAMHAASVDRVLVSPIPLESEGWLPPTADHPGIPLPAPATLELLRGFRTRPGGPGEVVTPTAAAILAALATPADGFPEMTVEAVGYGAGTNDPQERPNVVRVVIGSDPQADADDAPPVRDLMVLEANLDDLTPELVADAVQALLAAGALDVWTTPVTMKKGRSGVVLSALVEPDSEPRLRGVFFEATSTFGVRSHRVARSELERRTVGVDLPDGSVRVKVGLLGGRVVSATPEHDDVAAVAQRAGRPVRHVYEEAVAAARTAWLSTTHAEG
jgi:uncharacterized protein (TIGR00299 family) protein